MIRFFIIAVSVVVTTFGRAQDAGSARQISVESIGDSVTLVGRLGVPLGTKVAIRGTWSHPKTVVKDFSARFTVHHVNGKQLARPVEFNIAQTRFMTQDHRLAIAKDTDKKLLDGQEWTAVAYETGYIGLAPDEYADAERIFPVVGMPYYTQPFTSELIAVVNAKMDEPSGAHGGRHRASTDGIPTRRPVIRND